MDKEVWQSNYKNVKVVGVKDIFTNGFYREAINIVLDISDNESGGAN